MDLSRYRKRISESSALSVEGRITASAGPALRAVIPHTRIGDAVELHPSQGEPLLCEVVAFDEDGVTLLPLGPTTGVAPGDLVRSVGHSLKIQCSDALLGRVLDGVGQSMDAKGEIDGSPWDVMRPPPDPLKRKRVDQVLSTGIRAIDGLLCLGYGQRMGVFAGSGAGKSYLLGQIARGADADVVVVCLVGERGREVREFLEDCLGDEGQKKSVVVCATSDAPALVRLKSAYTATAIAEWFRDQGKRVLLLMDSVTRFARAAREVGLAAGEPPARRGYPPSVFAALPSLMERSGQGEQGSISAIYTVLVEGDDFDEPIADEVRGILDGHIVLDRHIGMRGRFPAIDPLASLSRVMDSLVEEKHRLAAGRLREFISVYESNRDLVSLGAYKAGSNLLLDDALYRLKHIENFLRQRPDEHASFEQTVEALLELVH
ncbi:MAG: FliI/YscN family ATPase [Myxococcales bacterium]|nr:MAG: FliI/YscN family ATPase [Myxococcales bacterium]